MWTSRGGPKLPLWYQSGPRSKPRPAAFASVGMRLQPFRAAVLRDHDAPGERDRHQTREADGNERVDEDREDQGQLEYRLPADEERQQPEERCEQEVGQSVREAREAGVRIRSHQLEHQPDQQDGIDHPEDQVDDLHRPPRRSRALDDGRFPHRCRTGVVDHRRFLADRARRLVAYEVGFLVLHCTSSVEKERRSRDVNARVAVPTRTYRAPETRPQDPHLDYLTCTATRPSRTRFDLGRRDSSGGAPWRL